MRHRPLLGELMRRRTAPLHNRVRVVTRTAALTLPLAAVACGARDATDASNDTAEQSVPPAAAITFVDAAGRTHALDGPARRIVSLVPSATETLRAIGASDVLVGRTDFDTSAWTEAIPSVGGGLEPNLEALVALRPDAVIRFEGDQDPRTPARLDELGIRHVGVRPVSLNDVYETNRIVGRLTGRETAADSLSDHIRQGLNALSDSLARYPRKRFVYMLGGSPPWVSGPDTYIAETLELLGGVNVFADLGSLYAAVSPEELRSRDIDVVLVSRPNAYDETLTPHARIEAVGEALQVPGPSVVYEATMVARILHGLNR